MKPGASRVTWQQKAREIMRATGKSYEQVCREMGSHGGKKAARMKRSSIQPVADLERRKLF